MAENDVEEVNAIGQLRQAQPHEHRREVGQYTITPTNVLNSASQCRLSHSSNRSYHFNAA